MNWVTIIWSMSAAVSLTLAGIHFVIWFQDRKSWANLWFSLLAVSVAAFAGFELSLIHAQTGAQFGTLRRWMHLPLFLTITSIIRHWYGLFQFGAPDVYRKPDPTWPENVKIDLKKEIRDKQVKKIKCLFNRDD